MYARPMYVEQRISSAFLYTGRESVRVACECQQHSKLPNSAGRAIVRQYGTQVPDTAPWPGMSVFYSNQADASAEPHQLLEHEVAAVYCPLPKRIPYDVYASCWDGRVVGIGTTQAHRGRGSRAFWRTGAKVECSGCISPVGRQYVGSRGLSCLRRHNAAKVSPQRRRGEKRAGIVRPFFNPFFSVPLRLQQRFKSLMKQYPVNRAAAVTSCAGCLQASAGIKDGGQGEADGKRGDMIEASVVVLAEELGQHEDSINEVQARNQDGVPGLRIVFYFHFAE